MEIKPITWRERWGNKLNRGLHSAMLHEESYHKRAFVRLLDGEEAYCQIEYDKEYVLAYLAKKVCEPFDSLGLETLLDLIKEAYSHYQQEGTSYEK